MGSALYYNAWQESDIPAMRASRNDIALGDSLMSVARLSRLSERAIHFSGCHNMTQAGQGVVACPLLNVARRIARCQ